MQAIEQLINNNPVVAWLVLGGAFFALAKCADIFVESAVALANRLDIPKLLIGLVLVSFATTAPELSVSLMAALKGNPEMALGNAIGSVICNSGLALGLAALLSVRVIPVIPAVLKTSGFFLVLIQLVTFFLVFHDNTLTRWEGLILLILFFVYMAHTYRGHRRGDLKGELETEAPEDFRKMSIPKIVSFFAIALAGIIFSSRFVVVSATSIALSLNVPEAVIALTLVAFGTSVPEVASCVMAARKGHGEIAVGNILGANILNICWVAGASSLVNPLALTSKQINFMFPSMLVIVVAMLIMLRNRYNLSKANGWALIGMYVLYLIVSVCVFPVGSAG